MKEHFIIGISGGSGSGKTSLVRQIREAFADTEVCIISQDDYYLPGDQQLIDENGVKNFDLPTSINEQQLLADLKSLMSGESLEREEYPFHAVKGRKTTGAETQEVKKITLVPAKIIVVEGLFVFHYEKVKALFDLGVFVDTKENLKLIRRIQRDKEERFLPLEDVLYRYENHVLPSYERYIEPYKSEADIVLNNHKNYDKGLEMLLLFIKSKL